MKRKVFCVGAGKTGTTSLAAFFSTLDYRVGAQDKGEALLRRWAQRDFAPIVALADTADFFQDLPFSCPYTFQAMDVAFPGSKFILTCRESNEWYRSLTTFHTALLGKGRLPTAEDLSAFLYRDAGWILDALRLVYGAPADDPYNRDTLIRAYERHNESVKDYFAHRPQSLLVVGLGAPTAAREIVEFVGERFSGQQLPHLNRTARLGRSG
jgi:hypothetical protein